MITTAPMIEKSEISLRVAVIGTLPIKRTVVYNPCWLPIIQTDMDPEEST